ncbi:class I glutamine amidotransferase-like protein [Hyaloraphidium curvatum]|nr:class I glutamine amidotransferase-like protein [Hyaloraphidium curvatum]
MPAPRRIAVLHNENHSAAEYTSIPGADFAGLFPALLARAAEDEGCTIEVRGYRAFAGELPSGEELAGFGAVLLTGSAGMVGEETEWMEREGELVRAWFRDHREGGVALVGVCFGQWVPPPGGDALGGRVEENPRGWECLLTDVALSPAGKEVFAPLGVRGDVLQGQQMHRDAVLRLAPGFENLGSSALAEHQAACLRGPGGGVRCMTVQWHPEIPCGAPFPDIGAAFAREVLGGKFGPAEEAAQRKAMEGAGWYPSGG